MKKKRNIINTLIILILTIIMLYILLKDHYRDIINSFLNVDLVWIIITFVIAIIQFICDSIPYYLFGNRRNSLKTVFYINGVGKFFNGITPLASGGQPSQIYFFHKNGNSLAESTNLVVQQNIIYQIAVITIAYICLFIQSRYHIFEVSSFVEKMTIFGYVANSLLLLFLLIVSLSKRLNIFIAKVVSKIISKLKFIKKKEHIIEKFNIICEQYYNNSKLLMKNKKIFLLSLLDEFISIILSYAIIYTLLKSLSFNISLAKVLYAGSFVYITGCFVPIPGATGGMEFAFSSYVGAIVPEEILPATLIMWRTITFYLPTIIGGILFNIQYKFDDLENKK